MKHVGKMKNNGAKVVVAYRTLPGDPHSALVIGTGGLEGSYHDALMSVVQDIQGQQANELADVLSVRKFPDGSNMLGYLHVNGHLKKVPTNLVIMTPTSNASVQLDELNQLIAEQKGISLDDLAVRDELNPNQKPKAKTETKTTEAEAENLEDLSPAELRSKADALFKQAQQLRKKADTLDPPKSKKKTAVVEAE